MPEASAETLNLPELCARAAVTESLTIERYARLLAQPTWSWLLQALDHTRAYERGLEVGFLLLSAHERFEAHFSEGESERNLASIYLLVLRMLDKLDLWEEFARAYDQLLEHTRLPLGVYAERSRANGAGPFILADVPGGFTVHFLYGLRRRREVVRRKIDRRSRGARLGNLRHARQSDLTEEELRERVEWVVRPGHDPDGAGRV